MSKKRYIEVTVATGAFLHARFVAHADGVAPGGKRADGLCWPALGDHEQAAWEAVADSGAVDGRAAYAAYCAAICASPHGLSGPDAPICWEGLDGREREAWDEVAREVRALRDIPPPAAPAAELSVPPDYAPPRATARLGEVMVTTNAPGLVFGRGGHIGVRIGRVQREQPASSEPVVRIGSRIKLRVTGQPMIVTSTKCIDKAATVEAVLETEWAREVTARAPEQPASSPLAAMQEAAAKVRAATEAER